MAAVITAAAGAGVGTLGLMLYAFDPAKAPLPPAEEAVPGQPKTPGGPAAPSMEISLAPLWAPGFGGGSVIGRF